MTNNKSSFAWEIKKEVINNLKKNQEITSFLNGVIFSNAILKDDYYVLNIRNTYILNKLKSKLDKVKINFNTKNTQIKIHKNNFILKTDFKEFLTSFFGGIFVGGGSISDKNSTSYHLEIKTNYKEHTEQIIEKLNEYDFDFHLLKRKEKYYAYIKKLDNLLDFLSAISAKKSWFILQNIKINRDLENTSNRMNNIDISNLQKIANSSIKYIENINYILGNNYSNEFTENQLVMFRIKLENPWISLEDLSKRLEVEHNIIISKSGLNHWFRKLNLFVLDKKQKS
ncbi:DNA-binding protein WhiA [Mycoplasmopsis felis]|uniref:DNA-binding protein WhiA n=1 Tax=Mycoplasmopsis felis TaxID=33923 RepID=UPI002AFF7A0B|nr:DNA-binding protein WhiA [Mycoplasmopsis felis]WQQ03218.1 DNA-binding protein WhiA [Mycoplasmopsis felis]